MLNNNKTYANKNLRDVQKVFTDGICYVYDIVERNVIKEVGKFYFSDETYSMERLIESHTVNDGILKVIGVVSNNLINPSAIINIDGINYRIATIQEKNYNKPVWYKIGLTRDNFDYEIQY